MRKNILLGGLLVCGSILLFGILVGWTGKPALPETAAIQNAAGKSLLLLQKSSYLFTNNSPQKCASCHHNTLTSMAAGLARQKNIPVIDSFTTHRVDAMEATIINACNPNSINKFVPANFIIPYVLIGLDAEKYQANMHTDISVDYLMSQANPDGSFMTESGRVPLETGNIHLTAMAIRSILLYAPPTKQKKAGELLARTKYWLEKSNPQEQQELAFQLLGLQWCGSSTDNKTKVAAKLKALQQEDGGWSQLPTMKTDAYATGQVLYALYESGMAKPEDAVYRNGLDYLLKTQDKEGAWTVQTRSYPIQKFVDSEFPPYDDNQFISAAATNWATLALLLALPDKTK
jgi:hypothetical protein